MPAADLARKHGFLENTIYNWKSKYGGMEVSDAKRLRELESEKKRVKASLQGQVFGRSISNRSDGGRQSMRFWMLHHRASSI